MAVSNAPLWHHRVRCALACWRLYQTFQGHNSRPSQEDAGAEVTTVVWLGTRCMAATTTACAATCACGTATLWCSKKIRCHSFVDFHASPIAHWLSPSVRKGGGTATQRTGSPVDPIVYARVSRVCCWLVCSCSPTGGMCLHVFAYLLFPTLGRFPTPGRCSGIDIA